VLDSPRRYRPCCRALGASSNTNRTSSGKAADPNVIDQHPRDDWLIQVCEPRQAGQQNLLLLAKVNSDVSLPKLDEGGPRRVRLGVHGPLQALRNQERVMMVSGELHKRRMTLHAFSMPPNKRPGTLPPALCAYLPMLDRD